MVGLGLTPSSAPGSWERVRVFYPGKMIVAVNVVEVGRSASAFSWPLEPGRS